MTKEEKIIEGNAKIAEFMGIKVLPAGYISRNLENNEKQADDLKYHSSWNWLMQVVEKIENIKNESEGFLFCFGIGRDFCVIKHNTITQDHISVYSEHNSKILSVFACIVRFIDWYNSQQK